MKYERIAANSAHSERSESLRDQGYAILPNAFGRERISALAEDLAPVFEATPISEGPFYGDGTKRFGGLLTRSSHARDLVCNPAILALVEESLGPWCDYFQLNLTQAIEILPGSPAQPPHRDQDMWGGQKGLIEYLVNVMWPLTSFTKDNGGTMIWPGSHLAQDFTLMPDEDPVYAEAEPGDAIVFLGSTQHSGGANITDQSRRGLIVSYSLGWLKPYELQTMVYPPAVARTFDPELAALLGYQIHKPNLGNVHGRCPSHLLTDGAEQAERAIDYLKLEHEMMIEMWRDDVLELGA